MVELAQLLVSGIVLVLLGSGKLSRYRLGPFICGNLLDNRSPTDATYS